MRHHTAFGPCAVISPGPATPASNALDLARTTTQKGSASPVVVERTTPAARPSLKPRTKGAAAPPPRAPLPHPLPPPERPGREADSRSSSGRPARLEPARQWVHTATRLPANTPENARQTAARTRPAPPRRARANRSRHCAVPPIANSFLGPE